jgi:hypothetical protein
MFILIRLIMRMCAINMLRKSVLTNNNTRYCQRMINYATKNYPILNVNRGNGVFAPPPLPLCSSSSLSVILGFRMMIIYFLG